MEIIINKSKQRLGLSFQNLEQVISKKLAERDQFALNQEISLLREQIVTLQSENAVLKEEVIKSKQEYLVVKETSQEVISELNNSIQIIEDFFKKDNANSKNQNPKS